MWAKMWAVLTSILHPKLSKRLIAQSTRVRERGQDLALLEDGFGADADVIWDSSVSFWFNFIFVCVCVSASVGGGHRLNKYIISIAR